MVFRTRDNIDREVKRMKNIYSCNHYKTNINLNLTCTKYHMRCLLLGSLDCSDYDDTKDCRTCRRLTIETYDGVCEIYGLINNVKRSCQYWENGEGK